VHRGGKICADAARCGSFTIDAWAILSRTRADFTNLLSPIYLQELAEADAAKEQIADVQVSGLLAQSQKVLQSAVLASVVLLTTASASCHIIRVMVE
jgi:hypothetical protein